MMNQNTDEWHEECLYSHRDLSAINTMLLSWYGVKSHSTKYFY